jgi:hypothetical protein
VNARATRRAGAPGDAPATPNDAPAASTGAEVMLTRADYDFAGRRMLGQFDGVLSRDELHMVLAARLSAATERFIKSRGSADAWASMFDLMCGIQVNGGKP